MSVDFGVALQGTLQSTVPGNGIIASQAQALAGVNDVTIMTPLKVAQALSAVQFDFAPVAQAVPLSSGGSGYFLGKNSTDPYDFSFIELTLPTGTVATVSVASANGLAGTSDGDPVNPALTLSTTVTGMVKGNGTALSAAVAGTDYLSPAAIGTTVQAYSANLTSWAAITRASGFDTFAATPSSANLRALLTDKTGTGAAVFATSPTLVTPNLGTPSALDLTNATNLPASALTGLGAGVATWLATPSSANLAAAVTGETGTGALVFGTSPTLVTPALGTPSALVLTNATGTPSSIGLANGTGLPITAGTTGTLGETRGGTGQTTYATGDLLYATAANTLGKLPVGTNGHVLTLAAGVPTWAAGGGGGGLTVGTTAIASGTTTRVLFDNAGVLGEYTISGTGDVAMTTSPVFTTPNIGAATGASLGVSGFISAARVSVSGNTVTSNGIYLPSANTLGFSVNTVGEMQLTSAALSPMANDGNALGTVSLAWSDLFGASGFVLNLANDWVATHTSGILTVGTGDLRVSNNFTNAASVVTVGGAQTLTNKTLTSPTLTTPALGTPASGVLTNATGLPLTSGVTGTLPVGNGGTGAASLTANNVLLGNGTSAVQVVAPGTSGNVLTSNGTTWTSAAASGGGQPIPTSSTFAVGTLVFARTTAGSTANGATIPGANILLATAAGGTLGTGATQTGTWTNRSGVTLDTSGTNYGYVARTA